MQYFLKVGIESNSIIRLPCDDNVEPGRVNEPYPAFPLVVKFFYRDMEFVATINNLISR